MRTDVDGGRRTSKYMPSTLTVVSPCWTVVNWCSPKAPAWTVLHLAAFTQDSGDWDGQLDITAKGTVNVFRAAQEAGIWRVVNMSTGSTMCGYEWYEGSPYGALARGEYDAVEKPGPTIDYTDPVRPDSPYGAAKAFTEAAGRWFSPTSRVRLCPPVENRATSLHVLRQPVQDPLGALDPQLGMTQLAKTVR